MSNHKFRVHPAVGFARVGDSEEYYLAPESDTGVPDSAGKVGGLPLKRTDVDGTATITSEDLRHEGKLNRQAARFRVFAYPDTDEPTYPLGTGTEIVIGSTVVVDGEEKTVADILWQVHLANKKACWYECADDNGIEAWTRRERDDGTIEDTPPLRNTPQGDSVSDPSRLRKLVIDPGPRTIQGTNASGVHFDNDPHAVSFVDNASVTKPAGGYPVQFPSNSFDKLHSPQGGIETLGELRTDAHGRLHVLPGFGRTEAWYDDNGKPFPITANVNNNGWFDDVADGPVAATLVFADGSYTSVGDAWVVTTDPAYAPQIRNAVTLWDDIHDAWVREPSLRLLPDVFAGKAVNDRSGFNEDYRVSFVRDVLPTLQAAALQQWIANFDPVAREAHTQVGKIAAGEDPKLSTGVAQMLNNPQGVMRDPWDYIATDVDGNDRRSFYQASLRKKNAMSSEDPGTKMPLSLGDAGEAYLALSPTQHFFIVQWSAGKLATPDEAALGPGEHLDRASFSAGLGGRFSPGIDMTYICRQPGLYKLDWAKHGPFRIDTRALAYASASPDAPFLGAGYTPLRPNEDGTGAIEPGDISKFMALPWQMDYNSCATHLPSPNPGGNNRMFWSWPAQRPVAIYPDFLNRPGSEPAKQLYSVRGKGTETDEIWQVGRYQDDLREEMLTNWQRLGTVIQGTAIDAAYANHVFLEAESAFDRETEQGTPVTAWPQFVPPEDLEKAGG